MGGVLGRRDPEHGVGLVPEDVDFRGRLVSRLTDYPVDEDKDRLKSIPEDPFPFA